MFDEFGYLTDEGGLDELEFYIVLVAPTPDNVPPQYSITIPVNPF